MNRISDERTVPTAPEGHEDIIHSKPSLVFPLLPGRVLAFTRPHRHSNQHTPRRTPICLRHGFRFCICLLMATCLLVCPLAQELAAAPGRISRTNVAFQIASPAAPTHKGFLGGVSGTWN